MPRLKAETVRTPTISELIRSLRKPTERSFQQTQRRQLPHLDQESCPALIQMLLSRVRRRQRQIPSLHRVSHPKPSISRGAIEKQQAPTLRAFPYASLAGGLDIVCRTGGSNGQLAEAKKRVKGRAMAPLGAVGGRFSCDDTGGNLRNASHHLQPSLATSPVGSHFAG